MRWAKHIDGVETQWVIESVGHPHTRKPGDYPDACISQVMCNWARQDHMEKTGCSDPSTYFGHVLELLHGCARMSPLPAARQGGIVSDTPESSR